MADEKWGMVVDIDRCTGCQACVVACQSENNIPINEEAHFKQRRPIQWMRIERYWEGEFPNIKARFIPVMCQHCDNAPCEPVCPVFATYHNAEGLNVQVYNRCIGTRFCANNCPYHARFFNFWEPAWPESLKNQLNPDVTVRSRGIMEKCTFCVQRIRRSKRRREARRGARGRRPGSQSGLRQRLSDQHAHLRRHIGRDGGGPRGHAHAGGAKRAGRARPSPKRCRRTAGGTACSRTWVPGPTWSI